MKKSSIINHQSSIQKPLRLLIAPAHYQLSPEGGSESTVAWEFLEHLSRSGLFEGRAITGWAETDSVAGFKLDRLYDHPTAVTNLDRFKLPFQVYRRAKHWLHQERFDAVWHLLPFGVNQTFSLISLRGLAKQHRIPFLIGPVQSPNTAVSDDEWARTGRASDQATVSLARRFERWSAGEAQKLFAPLSRATLNRAEHVLAVSEPSQSFWVDYGLDPQRLSVLPYGIDTTPYAKPRPQRRDRFDIVSIGYLVRRKQPAVVLEAFAALANAHKTATLTFIGSGPEEESLRALAKHRRVAERVRFAGFVPYREVPTQLKEFDCFISASQSEAFPHVFLEAMTASLPIVSLGHNGALSTVRNGKTGWIIPLTAADQAAALGEQLIDLGHSVQQRTEFGQTARRIVDRTFAWPVVARRLSDTIRTLR